MTASVVVVAFVPFTAFTPSPLLSLRRAAPGSVIVIGMSCAAPGRVRFLSRWDAFSPFRARQLRCLRPLCYLCRLHPLTRIASITAISRIAALKRRYGAPFRAAAALWAAGHRSRQTVVTTIIAVLTVTIALYSLIAHVTRQRSLSHCGRADCSLIYWQMFSLPHPAVPQLVLRYSLAADGWKVTNNCLIATFASVAIEITAAAAVY